MKHLLCRHIKNDEHLVWEICSNCTQLLLCIAFRLILVILFLQCTSLFELVMWLTRQFILWTLDTLINSLKHFNSQITIFKYMIHNQINKFLLFPPMNYLIVICYWFNHVPCHWLSHITWYYVGSPCVPIGTADPFSFCDGVVVICLWSVWR